jgi:hypothetical protein
MFHVCNIHVKPLDLSILYLTRRKYYEAPNYAFIFKLYYRDCHLVYFNLYVFRRENVRL